MIKAMLNKMNVFKKSEVKANDIGLQVIATKSTKGNPGGSMMEVGFWVYKA